MADVRLRQAPFLALWLLCICSTGVRANDTVTVFAAASAQTVLEALIPVLTEQGITLRAVHGGSSILARQIEQGAPADIFLSANQRWMDYLSAQGQIEPGTQRPVATNTLVLIAGPKPFAAPRMAFGPGYPLASLLVDERLAIADPDHVPAGIYGREALKALNMWDAVEDKLARTRDVTSALMMVARSEARLGVVYASDARRTGRVSVFASFPASSHTPILYPAAIVRHRNSATVRAVMDTLSGAQGQAAFRAAGFGGAP